MPRVRLIYLGLAIWGAIHPMFYFARWFKAEGFNLGRMVDAWQANDASSGLVWDLTIAAIALSVFVFAECIKRRDALGIMTIPATFGIGVSCGLPLYLFLRSRKSD
ncbi:MAG: DUF2834 domain-containing protein [Paracoccaceae bacterium]